MTSMTGATMLSIMTLSINAVSIMTFSIRTFSILTFSIMTFSITTSIHIAQHNVTQHIKKHCCAECHKLPFMLSFIMLRVMVTTMPYFMYAFLPIKSVTLETFTLKLSKSNQRETELALRTRWSAVASTLSRPPFKCFVIFVFVIFRQKREMKLETILL